jgi:CheY-like chemotaxis protein
MASIVLVEDDPMNARVFVMILERVGGHRVTVTEDVAEVLARAADGRADLVLMDVSLAHSRHQGVAVDGLGITRLLKADPGTRRIPVILLTAHAMQGDGERFLRESGADGYIPKPLRDYGELLGPVAQVLAARQHDYGLRTA